MKIKTTHYDNGTVKSETYWQNGQLHCENGLKRHYKREEGRN